MDWPSAAPALLTSLLILILPGIGVGLALRLRLFDALALSPLITITLISTTAIIASMLGIGWSIGVVLAAAVIAAALAFLVARRWPPASPRGPVSRELIYCAAALVGFLLIGWQVAHVIGSPENFSQTFDNVFHLNAVRYVLDTADASSLTLASMTSADQPAYFYPAAWHGFTSLVIQLSGAPLTVGVSAANIAISALIWPLSVLFAVRQLVTLSPIIVPAAGVVVGSFAAFPILLLNFGVLYPNLLSLAMVPAGLVLVAIVLRQAPAAVMGPVHAVFLAAIILPGIALAHPNGIMTLIVLAVPLLVTTFLLGLRELRLRGARPVHYGLASLAFLAVMGIVLVLWRVIRPPAEAATWNRVETGAQAFGEAILNAPMGGPIAAVISVLTIIGVVACLRRPRLLWLVGAWAVSIVLFVVAAGHNISGLRMLITGVWYNDPFRLAAVLPMAAAPLAILGLNHLYGVIVRWAKTSPVTLKARNRVAPSLRTVRILAISGSVVLVLALLSVTQGSNMDQAVADAGYNYRVTDTSALVDTDELELISQLDELTPEDAVIAVSPWTGAALAYALADRDTTYKHTLSNTSPDEAVIDDHLKDADSRPEVCDAVEKTGVTHVLDFGKQEVHGGDHRYPGIEKLDRDSDFELVTRVGNAKLYEFVGC